MVLKMTRKKLLSEPIGQSGSILWLPDGNRPIFGESFKVASSGGIDVSDGCLKHHVLETKCIGDNFLLTGFHHHRGAPKY